MGRLDVDGLEKGWEGRVWGAVGMRMGLGRVGGGVEWMARGEGG